MSVSFLSSPFLGMIVAMGVVSSALIGCKSASPEMRPAVSLLQSPFSYRAEGMRFAESVRRAIPVGMSKQDLLYALEAEGFRVSDFNSGSGSECVVVGTDRGSPLEDPATPVTWFVEAKCRDGVVTSVNGRYERAPLIEALRKPGVGSTGRRR